MTPWLIIVPCHIRPEMLFHCLDHLERIPRPDFEVWICQDHSNLGPPSETENLDAIGQFPKLPIRFRYLKEHGYFGVTYNLMLALRDGYDRGFERFLVIEEDVLAAPDILDGHDRLYEERAPWAVLSTIDGHSAVFNAVGTSFPRSSLPELLEHFRPEYLALLEKYLERVFPDGMKGHGQFDGLATRIVQTKGYEVGVCDPPKAWHIGWYGYNRGEEDRPSGTLAQRIGIVRKNIASGKLPRGSADCRRPPCWK